MYQCCHGGGTGDLLDLVTSKLVGDDTELIEDGIPRFAVVGRPNSGRVASSTHLWVKTAIL